MYTIIAFSENSPGILHRIASIFTRRKINIESLTVSETEVHGMSRFTIRADIKKSVMEKVAAQIRKVVEVTEVGVYANEDLIFKEVAFFRVNARTLEQRGKIEELAHRYDASVIHADEESLLIQRTGREEEIEALFLLFETFGIKEFVRSGRIAVIRN